MAFLNGLFPTYSCNTANSICLLGVIIISGKYIYYSIKKIIPVTLKNKGHVCHLIPKQMNEWYMNIEKTF